MLLTFVVSMVVLVALGLLIALVISFCRKYPRFWYLVGYYDCGRMCQLKETVRTQLNDLHEDCTFCHHNQEMLLLILFIMAHVGCDDFQKEYSLQQIHGVLEAPHVLLTEKYAFLGAGKRKFPLLQITYNPRTKSTIMVCTPAKTLYLILSAFLSTLNPIPFLSPEDSTDIKYHSGVMNLYNLETLAVIADEWDRRYKHRSNSLYIVGHSFGGASAAYLAFYLKYRGHVGPHQNVNVMTVASIRFGNRHFKSLYDSLVPNTLHIRATNDCLQRVPWSIPMISQFEEVGTTKHITISDDVKSQDSLHGVTAYLCQLKNERFIEK